MLRYDPNIKRLIDLILSITIFVFIAPLLMLTCIFIRLDSEGPTFFIQERIGKGMLPFRLVKFRSMTHVDGVTKAQFNPGDDRRVTRMGKFLRKTKIDELPELFNVIKGEMSIVGPRPELEKYVEVYAQDYKEILKIRPGLTDFASIKYRDEQNILADQSDPELYYLSVVLPDKLDLAKSYVKQVSFYTDLCIMGNTLKSIIGRKV